MHLNSITVSQPVNTAKDSQAERAPGLSPNSPDTLFLKDSGSCAKHAWDRYALLTDSIQQQPAVAMSCIQLQSLLKSFLSPI